MKNRTLIGMLTPSSNTVLEPYASAVLSPFLPEITAHFQRFTVTEISLDDQAMKQFTNTSLIEAAKILNDARMDVISWAGTAAGWRGFEIDEELCRQITEATGVQATTSVLALNDILERTNVRRLGLVTPYLKDVQDQIIKNYGEAGHKVVAERHLDDRGNFSFSNYEEETIADMIRTVAKSKPDAIIVLCTNFRGTRIVAEMEEELGIPVYDSVSATVWKTLAMTGHDPSRVTGWGSLFQDLR